MTRDASTTHQVVPAMPLHRSVTVKQIATAMGLSQPAVSQVLNGTGRISEETRQRVLKTAARLGYRPNAAARAVVTRKTRQVGVLVLNNPKDPETFPHTYFSILGMNMALEKADYVLCLVRIGDVEQSVENHSRVFREHVLDGVIATTSLPEHVAERIEQLVPACIWADANRWMKTHCVRRDELAVGRAAAEAAVAAGYRRIVFLTEERRAGGAHHYSHIERGKGIAAVCREAGIELQTIRQPWHFTSEFTTRLLAELRPEVALISTDTFRARLVQQTAAIHRLVIGEDFGLACCDRTPDVSRNWPELAGLPFDRMALGRRAAEMMLAVLEEDTRAPKSVLLPSVWHAGATLPARR